MTVDHKQSSGKLSPSFVFLLRSLYFGLILLYLPLQLALQNQLLVASQSFYFAPQFYLLLLVVLHDISLDCFLIQTLFWICFDLAVQLNYADTLSLPLGLSAGHVGFGESQHAVQLALGCLHLRVLLIKLQKIVGLFLSFLELVLQRSDGFLQLYRVFFSLGKLLFQGVDLGQVCLYVGDAQLLQLMLVYLDFLLNVIDDLFLISFAFLNCRGLLLLAFNFMLLHRKQSGLQLFVQLFRINYLRKQFTFIHVLKHILYSCRECIKNQCWFQSAQPSSSPLSKPVIPSNSCPCWIASATPLPPTRQAGGAYVPSHGSHFRLSTEIEAEYDKADLLICHGGAGTLLQNLHKGKLIIAVVNDLLMGNHQLELVTQLHKEGLILGFPTVEDFRQSWSSLQDYLQVGPSKRLTRPQNCVMNELVFGSWDYNSPLYLGMKNRVFLSSSLQTLEQAFEFIHPSFKPLSRLIPAGTVLSPDLQCFCDETFVLADPSPLPIPELLDIKKYIEVVNENVRHLVVMGRTNYVQCFGEEYKEYKMHAKNFNFGKTILETSMIGQLCNLLGIPWTRHLIYNYSIVMKYKGDYFQVTGLQLPEQLKFKAFGENKKKNNAKNAPNSANKKVFYLQEPIYRFQMLYCSNMNRNSGLFRKNVFFDKGVIKSDYYQEAKFLAEKQIKSMFPHDKALSPDEKAKLVDLMSRFFSSTRDVFCLKRQNNRNMCEFDRMLAKHCRLPSDYQQIKKDVLQYINTGEGSSEQLFERMYAGASDYRAIYLLCKNLVARVFPKELLGEHNLNILLQMLKQFISMKRYQNYKVQDFVTKMNVFEVPWLAGGYNKKFKKQIISRKRKIMGVIIATLFNKLLIPMVKITFYVTEKHKEANKLFYYRKPIWILVARLAMKKFSESNLDLINESQYFQIKKAGTDYPEGKLRLMPKKGTFRPIITFNRKRKVQGSKSVATLNQILSDTQLVLRNLKNILGNEIGYCIFDNRQISKKFEDFISKWRANGQPKLVYFTLDIKKCYDSIDTSALVKIIEKTPYIENMYLLIKYLRLYRNKRPLNDTNSFAYYFNLKERIHATSFRNDPMQIYEEQKNAINIFLPKQRVITRDEIIKRLKQLCDGSIIRYKKQIWLQKLGIPQGLNVSGVLCSLYFAYIEKRYVHVKHGLLMRLTDDYMYIGPEHEAVGVLTSMLECARQNKFVFNAEKIAKNFPHPYVDNITDDQYIQWIGKRININTLQIFPVLEKNQAKLAYAMNVNINRKQIKGFLKNKLKSLLTNHFSAYFKPHVYQAETLLHNIRLYCKISLAKFFPFLISLHKMKINKEKQLMLRILQETIHDFLIYACSFHEEKDRHFVYHKYLSICFEEFAEFLKSKRCFRFTVEIEKIFRARNKELRHQLKKYLQALAQ